MKNIILAFSLLAYVVFGQGKTSNNLKGTDNVVFEGENNQGEGNWNSFKGSGNYVWGDKNQFNGNNNRADGDENDIEGD